MLFIIEAIGCAAAGGKELTLDLLRGLHEFGRQHEFIALVPDAPDFQALSVPNLTLRFFPYPLPLTTRWWLLHITVPRICAGERADALLCMSNLAPRHVRCPIVTMVQNAYYLYWEKRAERRLTLREKLVLLYARRNLRRLPGDSRVIVQTDIMKSRFSRIYSFPGNRISIIPNGVGISFAEKAPSLRRSERKNTNDRVKFLTVARYYAHKNFEIIVEAARILKRQGNTGFQCIFTIEPQQHPRAARLLRQISREGLDDVIDNIGPVASDRLVELYRTADVLLFPTLLESMSRTYFEAMAMGLPIATSDRDFARHICGEAAAYFDPNDPVSVAGVIASLAANHRLRDELGEKCLRRWHEFSSHNTAGSVAARFIEELERAALAGKGREGHLQQQVASGAT